MAVIPNNTAVSQNAYYGVTSVRILRKETRGWKHKPWVEVPGDPLSYSLQLDRRVSGIPQYNPYNGALLNYLDVGGTNTAGWLQTTNIDPIYLNRAYAKLIDELHGGMGSQLGATLAEGREAVEMIVGRAFRLGKAYTHLKKGRFRDFLNELAVRPKPKHNSTVWTRPKDASALWLEYWFGWAPLVADIYAAIEVLNREFAPWTALRTSSGGPENRTISWDSSGWQNREDYSGRCRGSMGAEFRLVNPNHALLESLGIANPAAVLWELVPFSFLVDWFGNIGDYLSSYTDTMGYEIRNSWYTALRRGRCLKTQVIPSGTFAGYGEWLVDHAYMVRSVGFYRPIINFKLPRGLSVTRGATAIALLVSIFTAG